MAEPEDRVAAHVPGRDPLPERSAERHEALERRAADQPAADYSALLNARPRGPRPVQRAAAANRTGLPDRLKSGIEALSGVSLDGVKVHYNSSKPAELDAHAFAQGSDIHLAPGQERHLPHEAWHVVQQVQGRVKPTMRLKGGARVNDDAGLEREADAMGAAAAGAPAQLVPEAAPGAAAAAHLPVVQRVDIVGHSEDPPHPTQDRVNSHVVHHKVDALENGRYDLTYSAVEGERDEQETTLISDGHHAFVASQILEEDIPNEAVGVAYSEYTWADVQYSDDLGWYENWLRDSEKIDLDRAQAVFDADDDPALEAAWDDLRPWEKRALRDSDVYEYVRDQIEENDLTDTLNELAAEMQPGDEDEDQDGDEDDDQDDDQGEDDDLDGGDSS